MASTRERDAELVEQFVACFEKFNDMIAFEGGDPIAWQLVTGDSDQEGFRRWRPIKVDTDRSLLDPVYAKLPAGFPPLFERLVLSYRWAMVDLGHYRLLPNPSGPGFAGLLGEMTRDPHLWRALLPAGYIPFGKGPDVDYDPVCFDIKSRKKNRDCCVVKIDHEEILCNNRLKVVAELAPSFQQLMLQTIEKAAARQSA